MGYKSRTSYTSGLKQCLKGCHCAQCMKKREQAEQKLKPGNNKDKL